MAVHTNTAVPSSATATNILSLPASTVNALISVNLHNTGGVDDVVTIWISKVSSNPQSKDIVERMTLAAGETLTRTCGHMATDESVWVMCNGGTTAVRAAALIED